MGKGGRRRSTASVATSSKNPDAGADASSQDAPLENTNVIGTPEFTVYACNQEIATIEPYPQLNDNSHAYPLGNDSTSPNTLRKGGIRLGQAGWDRGLTFISLDDLADQLANGSRPQSYRFYQSKPPGIAHGRITRLAIAAHGSQAGLWFPNGLRPRYGPESPDEPKFWAAIGAQRGWRFMERTGAVGAKGRQFPIESVQDHRESLHRIGLFTRPGSTIILMGCQSGQGPEGTNLLVELAKIWPGRKIVAFTTIGKFSFEWMTKPSAFERSWALAGMKDTGCLDEVEFMSKDVEFENKFPTLQWASEDSEHAKAVVNDGGVFRMVKCPPRTDELCLDIITPAKPRDSTRAAKTSAAPESARLVPNGEKAAKKRRKASRKRKGATIIPFQGG
jgi:hypothetical protein